MTELIANLHPPRLPEAFVALNGYDLLAAFGLGLLLAAGLLFLLAQNFQRRARKPSLHRQLAAAAALPAPARELRLLELLRGQGVALPDPIKAALYRNPPPDPAVLEALLRQYHGGKS